MQISLKQDQPVTLKEALVGASFNGGDGHVVTIKYKEKTNERI